MDKPEDFLKIRVHDLSMDVGLSALCVGYERGEWRENGFSDHVMEWIPEFALKEAELKGVDSGNMVKLMRKAASIIYKSNKFKNRGEFGEIFLHIALRQIFNSVPVISKIYYKSSKNDTVKGFDCVHVVENDEDLELWIGEVKFYKSLDSAIKDVVAEIASHTDTDYLRDEFILIANKLDESSVHGKEVLKLLSPSTSLDEVFDRACIPVLLTYESAVVNDFEKCSKEYCARFELEIREAYKKFSKCHLPEEIYIHLILLPIRSKENLVACLDGKLKLWQKI
jgi:hypothetical protein